MNAHQNKLTEHNVFIKTYLENQIKLGNIVLELHNITSSLQWFIYSISRGW